VADETPRGDSKALGDTVKKANIADESRAKPANKATHDVRQFNQSINQNLYRAPSRSLLRGTPDPGQEEKNSLQMVVELRTGTIWEVP